MQTSTQPTVSANGTPARVTADAAEGAEGVLGRVDADAPNATNEHVYVRVPPAGRGQALRGQFVRIHDNTVATEFLGLLVGGPFFPDDGTGSDVRARVEVHGEFLQRLTPARIAARREGGLDAVRVLRAECLDEQRKLGAAR